MKFPGLKTSLVIILFFSFALASFATEKGRPYYEKKGFVLWEIKTEDKVIALTFDDGPHSTYTPQILDLLSLYDAKATFFVVGERAEKHPEIILREIEDGHEIANHTYTHPFSSSIDQLKMELEKTNKLIHSITGIYPALYRPVGGNYNEHTINTAVESGYKVVMWSWHQDTEDWKRPGTKKIINKVLSGTTPGNIILFHDAGGDRSQTVEALKEIIPELKKQGYEFVTVSELLNRSEAQVNK
ncbi:polysaccharide deacetylase family protein [Sporosarcina soli]|uniref:Polysaccharide deacetylase family protein n=1 Tax=Sporosarcina soli TaxID=334736 RepID=A0ABW0TMD4_9BACL